MQAQIWDGDSRMDWEELRLVQVLARHGSLSAAARSLGTTQPTLSRRLDAFETKCGHKLFERHSNGLMPTVACQSILSILDQMEASALAVERRFAAQEEGLQGTVTVTTLDWLGDYVIAPILAKFAADHPGITINLINDSRRFNLSRRDADIAFRFGGFDQKDIVEWKVAEIRYGLFASRDYIERFGKPAAGDSTAHSIVELAEAPVRVSLSTWLKEILPDARVILRTNSIRSQLSAVEAGVAVATLPFFLAADRLGLLAVDTGNSPPTLPLVIGVHSDMRRIPRIRKLIDFAVSEFVGLRSRLSPARP
ncbi:LysR family transcriptional regulator [Ensifer sp. 1H6]|uniref:LysR family transcriptional regulator n=1 Tax=Ensifer sp. 1H6 TaxID=1911585 RepID=UPI000FE270D6|nr:LysR family transcriptional regulator [Ensifer sp. 1H6]